MALELWASLNNVPLSDGPILSVLGGTIILSEVNQFEKSSVVLAASDARAVLSMQPYTLLEIVQQGLGTISYGYILNPRQQITENDDSTITLELEPLTVECTWELTGRGWNAQTFLSTVAERLAALVPGWQGVLSADPADDPIVNVSLDNPTVLGGYLDTAKQFAQFVRLGADGNGVPTRILEMGQFGAAPTVTLVSPDGGDPDALAANGTVALAATVDYQPGDVSQLVNLTVPFGGGGGDSLVTLERLWRIVNDPLYINYGKWGDNPGSVFPEYDPAKYPISDPKNPPTGLTQWKFTDLAGNDLGPLFTVTLGARDANGVVPVTVRDVHGVPRADVVATLWQGAYGTRAVTLDGHFDYPVYDAASYPLYGRKMGQLNDAGLTYTDNNPANQEQTQRALYLEAVANFARFAHPHRTFTCTAPGTGRPTRAGDLIAVDYQRVSAGENGAVVEINVQENLRVMKVERAFGTASNGSEVPPVDTYTLSNLGRFDTDDASQQADTARTLISFQLRQDTAIAPFPIGPVTADVDAETPMEIPLIIPAELFRWHKCVLRVDFQNYRGTGVTAENVAGTPISFNVPHGDHTIAPQPGHAFGGGGIATSSDGFALNNGGDTNSPIQLNIDTRDAGSFANQAVKVIFDAGKWILNAAGIGHTPVVFGKIALTADQTATSHTVPIQSAVSVAANLIALLPVHVHPINQQINKGPLPVNCTVAFDGLALTSGVLVSSGTRNADGTFAGSFQVDDISPFIAKPGQTVMLTLSAGTDAGNTLGVGRFQATLVAFGEWGSLAAAGVIAS
jgi:hypothetical protein